MEPEELLNHLTEDLKTVLGGQLPQLCRLERQSSHYQQPDEVKQALKDFHPQEGWLCFQSTITHFINGELPDKGILLYGEVKSTDNKSLHIRQSGTDGSWLLTTYQEEPGNTHLVEITQLLGEFDHPGDLRYRVYWQPDGEQGYRKIGAAFDGFVNDKGL